MTNLRERALSLRYNLVPDHLIGEILTKRWADNAIPFLALIATVAVFGTVIPGFFKPQSLSDSTRQLGEFSIVVTGMTVVMLGGGIDLSVGSIFALATFAAVSAFFIFDWPVWAALAAALATGGLLRRHQRLSRRLSAAAGVSHDARDLHHRAGALRHPGGQLRRPASSSRRDTSDLWDFIGDGTIHGLSISRARGRSVIAIIAHIAITRSRPGWHVLAVGGSRRSAHNSGIRVRRDRVHDLCHLRPAAAGLPDF